VTNFWQQLKLDNKPFLTLAPLDGVTDFVFREMISETAKPDVLFTEFTNTEALFSKGYDRTIPRLKFSEKQHFIVAQVWGTDPKNFYAAAKLVKELGFDGIDINMGCPDRGVLRIGSGAAHIKNPTLAGEIISATKDGAGGLPVSVKTRIGVSAIVTESWAEFLLEQKLSALIIHGRTAKEQSKVPAHWDEIEKVVKLRDQIAPDTVVVGNGDITSYEEAVMAHTRYGVDGVMIGKGVFLNPWVFEKVSTEHITQEYLKLLLKHTKLYCDTYKENLKFDVMKKFFKVYVKSFRGADKLREQLMDTDNYEQVADLVKPYLSS